MIPAVGRSWARADRAMGPGHVSFGLARKPEESPAASSGRWSTSHGRRSPRACDVRELAQKSRAGPPRAAREAADRAAPRVVRGVHQRLGVAPVPQVEHLDECRDRRALQQVADCVARQWLRFALSRPEADLDEPSIAAAAEQAGGDMPVGARDHADGHVPAPTTAGGVGHRGRPLARRTGRDSTGAASHQHQVR